MADPHKIPPRSISIDISYGTFVRIAILALAAVFLYIVRDLLLLIFVAIVIASAIDPLVDRLQANRIPRSLTVLFVFLIVFGILALLLGLLVPALLEQMQQLIILLPHYADELAHWVAAVLNISPQEVASSDVVANLSTRAADHLSSITNALSGVVRGIFSSLIILVLSFYFVVQEGSFKSFVQSIVPARHRLYVSDLIERVQVQMGKWLRGQLILVLSIFVLTYALLSLLGVPNALALATLAGFLEVVPYIGPIISAVPAVLLAITVSPVIALMTAGGYVVVQQVENHVLHPRVMGKVLGLNPLVVILVILVGANIAGVLGAILAVPIATAVAVFIGDMFSDAEPLEERLRSRGARDVRAYKPGFPFQKNEEVVDEHVGGEHTNASSEDTR